MPPAPKKERKKKKVFIETPRIRIKEKIKERKLKNHKKKNQRNYRQLGHKHQMYLVEEHFHYIMLKQNMYEYKLFQEHTLLKLYKLLNIEFEIIEIIELNFDLIFLKKRITSK